MSKYEEAMKILNEKFGNKDNVIALATISLDESNGKIQPNVRDVDAYYEDGVFYVSTYGLSNKIKQINANSEIALSVNFADFKAVGIGKNLGWVMKPENSELREKLRKTFAAWYDFANNENDENCCILALYMNKGSLRIDHGVMFYDIDFTNKTAE